VLNGHEKTPTDSGAFEHGAGTDIRRHQVVRVLQHAEDHSVRVRVVQHRTAEGDEFSP